MNELDWKLRGNYIVKKGKTLFDVDVIAIVPNDANLNLLYSAPDMRKALEMVKESIKNIPVNEIPELAYAMQFVNLALDQANKPIS